MVRNGKARQAKGFSFLTAQLTRWRSAVRARAGLPSLLLILLNRGMGSRRNVAKLVTIRHQLRKVFEGFPQVRGNRHRVDLERRGHLVVTELYLRISSFQSATPYRDEDRFCRGYL